MYFLLTPGHPLDQVMGTIEMVLIIKYPGNHGFELR